MLISVAEGRQQVVNATKRLPEEITPLTTSVLGQVLAEEIVSDIDSPPFDKAMMDGYAVRSEDCQNLPAYLQKISEISAGQITEKVVQKGQCIQIMTGAPIPPGADAVVPIEQTKQTEDGLVTIEGKLEGKSVRMGQHRVLRGEEMKKGETVLPAGSVLAAQDFGLLASVGRTTIKMYPAPQVSVIATGNELIEPMMKLREGKIRNSNGPMLMAQVIRAGGLPRYLGIARDEESMLTSLIKEGLETTPITLLSGGVSAGKYDLVPKILAQLGATIHFHHVAMRPGKPLLFATLNDKLIYGLPGNPVSSFVCFELFVRPAIRKMRGHTPIDLPQREIPLAQGWSGNYDRPCYFPAYVKIDSGKEMVHLADWSGSFDLRGLSGTNALLYIPAGTTHIQQNQLCTTLIHDFTYLTEIPN